MTSTMSPELTRGLVLSRAAAARNLAALVTAGEVSTDSPEPGAARGSAKSAIAEASKWVNRARRRLPIKSRDGEEPTLTRTRVYLAIEQMALETAKHCLAHGGSPQQLGDDESDKASVALWKALGKDVSADAAARARNDPQLAYAAACYLVRWQGASLDCSSIRELLDCATILDAFLQFAQVDPELKTAPDKEGFEALKTRLGKEQKDRAKLKADVKNSAKEPDPRVAVGPRIVRRLRSGPPRRPAPSKHRAPGRGSP